MNEHVSVKSDTWWAAIGGWVWRVLANLFVVVIALASASVAHTGFETVVIALLIMIYASVRNSDIYAEVRERTRRLRAIDDEEVISAEGKRLKKEIGEAFIAEGFDTVLWLIAAVMVLRSAF